VDYPTWQRDDITDEYFGHAVADPFRWLEAEESDAVASFIERQNALTAAWIPREVRDAYLARLRTLVDYPRCSLPSHEGRYWTTLRNTGLQQQGVLFKQTEIDGDAEVLIDPNTFSADGTVSLALTSVTRDGALLAYGKSVGGSDDQTIFIKEVATGVDLPDVLAGLRFSNIAWARDNSGFWYNRFPDPASRMNNTVYWHKLGTSQADDIAIYARPQEPEVHLTPVVTEGSEYLFIYFTQGTSEKNGLLARALGNDPAERDGFREIQPLGEASFTVIESEGTTLYVLTDKNAPRRKVVAVDLADRRQPWREILPQTDDMLTDIALIDGRWAVVSLRDVHSMLKIYEKDGTFVREVPLPTKGTVAGISGRLRDKEMYFLFMSYTYPGVIYRYEMASGRMAEYYRSEVGFDPDRYETEQLFVTSKDGTRVPVFVTSRKGLPRDGGNPTILYGYGGFSISLAPFFSPALIPWLESGGVYAVANLRGGGEYGTAWHDEGMLERKQNVFDDFAAAAERLIAEGITSAPKLAIEGGSNGGLLVAASLLQRPELFGAAVSQVPVTDMLRYQKIGTGRFWMTEYGDATASREAFDWLRAYSPLHNVAAGRSYPPLLVTTADGDDRVAPLHAFKFVATMQATAGSGVYLLRHDMGAGHGAGKPLEMILAEVADTYAFLARALGVSSVESES